MKLVTVSEMIKIEKEANANGLTYDEMMENAGSGLAEVILEEYSDLTEQSALGLVGSGNNGGDTLVTLAILAVAGWKVNVYLVRERPEEDPLVSQFVKAGGIVYSVGTDEDFRIIRDLINEHALLLDGVLGTGINLPLRGKVSEVLKKVRDLIDGMESPPEVVAVDCPSGVDCDSGEAAPECVPADITVTMAAVKSGLLKFPAFNLIGRLRLVGIGLSSDDSRSKTWRKVNTYVADANRIKSIIPDRPLDAHKGTFGTALVVAGSVNYTGAALLAGKAAYRAGVGLVTLAVPAPLHNALAGHLSEATWILLPHELGVISASAVKVITKNIERTTAILLGPGFGTEDTTKDFLTGIIGGTSKTPSRGMGVVSAQADDKGGEDFILPPTVVDADGLKLLIKIEDWEKKLPALSVLTPHPGEMSIMTDLSVNEIQSDRLETARRYAEKWGHVVVLKGAHTIVAAPDGQLTVIPVATPSLARAGTGDVLAGLIVGLLAQGVEASEAAIAGCWIHSQAGLCAEAVIGNSASVMAEDVLDGIPGVLSELNI